MGLARLRRQALCLNLFARGALSGKLPAAVFQLLLAARRVNMLNTYEDLLFDVPVPDDLVHNDADRTLAHGENDASLAVVEFVRHALLNGAVHLDVDEVADLVDAEVIRKGHNAVFPVPPGKHVASTVAITSGLSHG